MVSIMFLGHVDVGKSQICNKISELYNNKVETMDICFDEHIKKNITKTVEVGYNIFNSNIREYVILDAPGHKGYIPSLVSKLCISDIVIMVISVYEYESGIKGQTKEHLILANSMGIKNLVILVNKMDFINWDLQIYNNIVDDIKNYLKYLTFTTVQYTYCSGLTGRGIKEFIDILDKFELPQINTSSELICLIVNSENNNNNNLICKILQGDIYKNDIKCYPQNKSIKVLSNNKYGSLNNINIQFSCNLKIIPGNIISNIDNNTNILIAYIYIYGNVVLTKQYECIMHIHCETVDIIILDIIQKTYAKKKDKIYVKIKCKNIIYVTTQDICDKLSRIILRKDDETIAYGKIMKKVLE